MLSIKQFNKSISKLKEFLMQIRLKLQTKKAKFMLPGNSVIYIGLLLTERALEWFKPYLTQY